MNNLHRELAPISESAWASIEEEARRTFTINLAPSQVASRWPRWVPVTSATASPPVRE
jgi:uncharacterized linocin/CFP29 family protein